MKDTKETKQPQATEISKPSDTLFAAVNSGKGFVSFYEDVFNRPEIKRKYIIKGGPGTGKSSFMKEVAAYAREQGKCVAYYRCSSDPDSLDGIIVDGRIAMVDGTSPHNMDADLPGARDEIINLGAFWDGEKLAERYNEIVTLGACKQNCYRKAYRFLSAAAEMAEINRELIHPFLKIEKMQGAARRILKNIPNGEKFRMTVGIADSVGMKGKVRLDTYEKQAKKLYVIEDCYETGSYFLSELIALAAEKKCEIRVSYQPVLPDLPDAVMFVQSGICFVLAEGREEGSRINMKRFCDTDRIGERKVEYRINRRLYEALLESAVGAMSEAGEYHFRLEQIYGSCMDFESQKKFIRSFCQTIR